MNKQKIVQKLRTTPLIRVLAWPIENCRREIMQKKYLKSDDSAFIKSMYNKYNGGRCFIIGNGPSLKPEDLDKLAGEVTFASNRIYYIYPRTQWRPTYYLCVDNNVLVAEMDRVRKSGPYLKLLNYKAASYGRKPEDNIRYLYIKGRFHLDPYRLDATTLSEDVSHHCTQNGTVTVVATELAVYMGFKEIYYLGVDNSYAKTRDKDGKIHVDTSIKSSYFEGMKDGMGKSGDGISVFTPHYTNPSYEITKRFANEHGVKIYNATRGGKLEVFERVDFDTVVKNDAI